MLQLVLLIKYAPIIVKLPNNPKINEFQFNNVVTKSVSFKYIFVNSQGSFYHSLIQKVQKSVCLNFLLLQLRIPLSYLQE